MAIILDNLEQEIIEKLENLAQAHGHSLTEEIKMILVTETNKEEQTIKYNAWGKAVTKDSIKNAINQMRKLRKTITLDNKTIQNMREQGRRF